MVEWSFDTRDAQAARKTRLDFVDYVRNQCGKVDVSSAELVLGELLSNVARYAPGIAHVIVDVDDAWVTIMVSDQGRGFQLQGRAKPDPLAERGRGLMIVETLAHDVDVNCKPAEGCKVRARIPLSAHA